MDSLKTICFIECIKNEQIYNEFLNLPKYIQNVLSKDYIKFTNYYDIIRKYNLCKKYLNGINISEKYKLCENLNNITATDNYIRNVCKLKNISKGLNWDNLSTSENLTVSLYEEFWFKFEWGILFFTGNIPKNQVAYLLKNYQKNIKERIAGRLECEKLDEVELTSWRPADEHWCGMTNMPRRARMYRILEYFLKTGILIFDNYDLLDHIEDTCEIFIFEQLSQL